MSIQNSDIINQLENFIEKYNEIDDKIKNNIKDRKEIFENINNLILKLKIQNEKSIFTIEGSTTEHYY